MTTNRSVKQVIVMRRDLKMRRGKEISQASHGVGMWLLDIVKHHSNKYEEPSTIQLTKEQELWIYSGITKICVKVDSEHELMELYHKANLAGLTVHLVTDAGLTEFGGVPTNTCICIGPNYSDEIDKITGTCTLY